MSDLFHVEYDPIKAHEYYLRTRELKGRSPAAAPPPPPPPRRSSSSASAPTQRHAAAPHSGKSQAQIAAEMSKKAAQRTFALKVKLEKLRNILKALTAKAKREGVIAAHPHQKNTQDSSSGSSGGNEKLSGKEAQDARDASKKYYEKHKAELAAKRKAKALEKAKMTPDQKIEDLTKQIQQVQDRIDNLRVKFAAAKP